MTRIILDLDPPQTGAPEFTSDTQDLVYFLSWAYATRYGASHELSMASRVLRQDLGIDLQPLLTFADREVEDPDDQDALDIAWQDAAPLAACCSAVTTALSAPDGAFEGVLQQYPSLRDNVHDLGQIAAWAAERGARIRVTYELDGEPV